MMDLKGMRIREVVDKINEREGTRFSPQDLDRNFRKSGLEKIGKALAPNM